MDDDGPLTIEFMNGTPTSEYDLVVACDGATSRTRAMGFGCGVRDHIHPVNAWAAYFSISKDLLHGSRMGHACSSPPGRFVGIGPDNKPGVNRVTMMSIHPRKDPDATLPFRRAARQGDAALKEHVAKRFAGAGWEIDEVTKGMMETDDFYASELVQVKVPSLHRGRFVLVGDAGYATGPTGTGTSIALAGAYLLAGEVCKHKGDLAAGLQGYEERMRPLISEMQQIPPGVPGMMAPQTAFWTWVRNTLFTFVCWAMALGSKFSWVGGLLGSWSSAFGSDKSGLPDYEWVS